MSWTDLPLLVLLPILAVVSGFCAASETALFSLTHSDRQRLKRLSPRSEAVVARLLGRPRRLLLAILLLTNAANVTYFVVSAVLERRAGGHGAGLALSVLSLLALVLVADLVPKLLARRVRVGAARVLARPLGIVLGVVGPACGFLETWVVMPLVRLVRSDHGAPQLDVDELASVLELSARSGEIRADEQRALGDIIELGQLRVRDVMTPRVSMLWIDAAAGVDAARVEVMRARRERLPVFAGGKSGMDEPPIGFLNVRRFVQMLAAAGPDARRSDAALRASLDPVTFVPERARLDRAFDLFRARRTTSAMVVDEFGGVVGIVAMSDLVRQMVAPARRAELLAESATGLTPVVRVRADAWSVSGRLPLRALREFLFAGAGGADGGGASTIAGLVMQRLGRVPRVGDEVEVGGLRARVTEMGERVIERVEISVPPGRVEARS